MTYIYMGPSVPQALLTYIQNLIFGLATKLLLITIIVIVIIQNGLEEVNEFTISSPLTSWYSGYALPQI
jgi:hypothetical protein